MGRTFSDQICSCKEKKPQRQLQTCSVSNALPPILSSAKCDLGCPRQKAPSCTCPRTLFLSISSVGGGCPDLRSSLAALGRIFHPLVCSVTHVGGKRDQGHCSECKVPTDMVFLPSLMRKKNRGRQNKPKQKKVRSCQMAQSWCFTKFLALGTVDILNSNDTT